MKYCSGKFDLSVCCQPRVCKGMLGSKWNWYPWLQRCYKQDACNYQGQHIYNANKVVSSGGVKAMNQYLGVILS